MSSKVSLLHQTATIVAAYVANNPLPLPDYPSLIAAVHQALADIATPSNERKAAAPTPFVPIRKSVTTDYIVCLEDGKRMKLLKRHLKAVYNMTPDEYRARWGLPADYPMIAPNYARKRSALARKSGLGRGRAAEENLLHQD